MVHEKNIILLGKQGQSLLNYLILSEASGEDQVQDSGFFMCSHSAATLWLMKQ